VLSSRVGSNGGGGDDLGSQAAFLKDCLAKSQGNHERLMGILGSFDRRLSSLESAMVPPR